LGDRGDRPSSNTPLNFLNTQKQIPFLYIKKA